MEDPSEIPAFSNRAPGLPQLQPGSHSTLKSSPSRCTRSSSPRSTSQNTPKQEQRKPAKQRPSQPEDPHEPDQSHVSSMTQTGPGQTHALSLLQATTQELMG